MNVVRRVASLHVELGRRPSHLLEHELGVEEDDVALDALTGLGEQLERLVLRELDSDLRHDAAPAGVEGRDRLGGEDLVAGHLVREHD